MALQEATYNKYCLVADEWLINGFNGTMAYHKFYPNANTNACDRGWAHIYRNIQIVEYLKTKQQKTAKTMQITLESQLLELNRLKGVAEQLDKPSDAINALKEQNKLLGLYEKDNSQQKTVINNVPSINIGSKVVD